MQTTYYRISVFARKVGVNPATLRRWEQMGILLPHHKSPTGYRYYSDEQVEEIVSGKLLKTRLANTGTGGESE